MRNILLIGLAGLWLTGCATASSPALPQPATTISLDQAAFTEQTERWGVLQVRAVYVPLPPEPLAALMADTARQGGWTVQETTRTGSGDGAQWNIHLQNGGDFRSISVFSVPGGKSKFEREMTDQWTNDIAFPSTLLPHLQTNVTNYLTEGKLPVVTRTGPHSSPATISVTTGPLSQPSQTLGTVEADTTDIGLSTSDLKDALFRSRFAVAVQGRSPKLSYPQMDERLRAAARQRYGSQADAVINVTYRTNYDGDVFASGLAVHFVEPAPTPAPAPQASTLEQKLTELKNLREKNLITPEEYYDKRSELLKGL